MSIITAEQVRALWNDPAAVIDRGDGYELVTQDDLGVFDIDTDDDGIPLADQWQVIADQLNSTPSGKPTSTAGHVLLQQIVDARTERDRVKREADEQFNAVIRAAVASGKVPVVAIAEAADLSRGRIYQIRDGRR